MLCACANSVIACKFSVIISNVDGPVLPAMSLVPASTIIAAGFKSITSGNSLTNICGVVWPLMPRFTYALAGNDSASFHPSVMESPMKTTRPAGNGSFFNFSLSGW